MRDLIRKFMERDKFSDALLISAAICFVLGFLGKSDFFSTIAFCLLFWGFFRIYSKDVRSRQRENEQYLKLRNKIAGLIGAKKHKDQPEAQRRQTQYYEQPRSQRQNSGQSAQQQKGPERPGPVPRSDAQHEYVYFTCPTCRKTLRVPAGQGAITVHCPHCRYEFDTAT